MKSAAYDESQTRDNQKDDKTEQAHTAGMAALGGNQAGMATGGGGFGGTSSREVIELYADGTCSFRSSSSISITAGASAYSGSKSAGAGTWDVLAEGQTPILRLSLGDGTVKTYRLAYEKKKLYLGGYRYFWTSLNSAPD
jgi:hypothetical protein